MEILDILPHFQAATNAISLILIILAYLAIKSGHKLLHRRLMISALGVSAAFLVSYLYYHAIIGHVPFKGEGGVRVIYFALLFAHIFMAAVALVLIILSVWRALVEKDFSRHKAISRYTFSIWAFVCASGIVVYVMAFHIYTGTGA